MRLRAIDVVCPHCGAASGMPCHAPVFPYWPVRVHAARSREAASRGR